MRQPLPPRPFLARISWFEFSLSVVQLVHLSFFSTAQPRDFVAWAFVHTVAQLSLWVLRDASRDALDYPAVPWRALMWLLVLTGIAKLASRAPYVNLWLSEGLLSARTELDEGTSGGGLASFVNIFFYPLAILLAFAKMPRRAYRWQMLLVLMVSLIDMIALGTRNAPAFVLLFHVLLMPVHLRPRHFGKLAAALAVFVALFGYSTVNRTQDAANDNFDWLVLFEFTKSSEVLQIDRHVAEPIAENAPVVLPAIFLAHYLTHSVAELAYLVNQDDLRTGHAHHTIYQLCVIRVCSQEDSLKGIETDNPRAGVYQTVWGSLILDFGFVGAGVVWLIALAAVALLQRLRRTLLSPVTAVAAQIIALGQIENYLFNGLGLIQIVCLFVVLNLLQLGLPRRQRPSSSPAVPRLPAPAS